MRDMLSVFESGNLPAALGSCAAAWPDTPLVFPEIGKRITVAQLQRAAGQLAGDLVQAGVRPQDVVGLLSITGPQVLTGVFGITSAGAVVSVLPNPPVLRATEQVAERLAGLAAASGMQFLLADQTLRELAQAMRARYPALTVLELTTSCMAWPESTPALRAVQPDDIAIIQYTSGSTARPKGVVLRHRTVLAGLRSTAVSAHTSADDVFIQWVPHFHDMGLFGWLQHVLCGVPTHTFSPAAFIRRPAEFLRYFAHQGGTVTTGPNFAYDLMLDAVDDQLLADLDLSRWRLAFNGAEPVSPATVSAFARRLAAARVRPETMYPVYGMAEATLAVTFPDQGDPPRILHVERGRQVIGEQVRVLDSADPSGKAVVSVGRPIDGMEIRIVDEMGKSVAGTALGEIQICGNAVTEGYWFNQRATEAALDGSWFRTGDLGFQYETDLYVLGRLKDMIIIRGENFFAEDAEEIVRDIPGVFRRRCIAVPDEDEHLTVVAEARNADESLAEAIRIRIASELGVSAIRVRLVPPGKLPRTTSGKWQRSVVLKAIGA